MTYNPRQTFEAGRGSIYSSYKPPSKSKPKPSRNSMTFEPGRGSIYDTYKPPKKSKPKPPNRNTGGYDPVGGGSIDDPGYKGPGLGSPPNTGNDKDDSSSQDTFIDTLMKKVKSSFNFAGGTSQNDEPTEPDPVSVYTADVFEIPTIQVGYENPNPMRSGEEMSADIARMFDRSKDKGYYQYSTEADSRYDEVPAASANKNLEVNKTKSAVERFLKDVIAPDSKEYKIKKNDTLSAIALREGVTVEDLVKVNGIKDKDRIYTDETLIIPESKDMQKVKDFVDSIDPDAQFYQSGVSMEDREFEPELGYDEIALPSEATVDKKIKGLGARPEVTVTELDPVVGGYDDGPLKDLGLMSPTKPQPVDAITAAKKDLTNKFYDDIGTYGESDHGDTPVQSNDVGADADDLDVGYGHKLKQSEKDSGMIHGIKFKNEDGTYIPLTEVQKREILKKDFERETNLARNRANGWDSKLETKGSSWDQLDFKYQNALSSLAFNVGGTLAGDDWDRVLDAAIAEDPKAFATEMRRTRDVRQPDGTIKKVKDEAMDNRVAKELYYSGIIDKLSEVSDELPEATAGSGVPQ